MKYSAPNGGGVSRAAGAKFNNQTFRRRLDVGLGGNVRIWKKFLPEEDISELIEKASEKGIEVTIEKRKGFFGTSEGKSVGLSGTPSVIRKLFEKYS